LKGRIGEKRETGVRITYGEGSYTLNNRRREATQRK